MTNIKDFYDQESSTSWVCKLCQNCVNTKHVLTHLRREHPDEYQNTMDFIEPLDQVAQPLEALEVSSTTDQLTALDDGSGEVTEIRYVSLSEVEEENDIIYQDIEEEAEQQHEEPQQLTYKFVTPRQSKLRVSVPARKARPNPEDKALRMFFMTMYGIVRKMSPRNVSHMRRRIFNLVSEMEEKRHY